MIVSSVTINVPRNVENEVSRIIRSPCAIAHFETRIIPRINLCSNLVYFRTIKVNIIDVNSCSIPWPQPGNFVLDRRSLEYVKLQKGELWMCKDTRKPVSAFFP